MFSFKDSEYRLAALVSILDMQKVKCFIQHFDKNKKKITHLCVINLIYISVLEIQE